jgi:uncharacterized delta-60 repeat protein
VLAGTTFNNGTVIDFGVARLNASDGSLDTSFGTNGQVSIDFGSPAAVAHDLVVQPNGRIVVSGISGLTGSRDFALARLNADGSLDASFADGGKKLIDFAPAADEGRGVALQADGKIIVAGSAPQSGSGLDFVLARLLGDQVANSPPTASAGGPYLVTEGGQVLLDASASTDPDQDSSTLTYAWDLDGDGEFDDATGAIVSFSAATLDGPTSITVSVRVTDAQGLSDTDTATVDVVNVAPTVTVNASSDTALGSLFTLTLHAADPSAGDQNAGFTYLVNWGDGSTDSIGPGASGTGTQVNHTYDRIGVYVVTVRAVDRDGGTSAAATTTVTVSGAQVLADPVDSSRTALFVGGTSASDTIEIRPVRGTGSLNVLLNGVSQGTFTPTGRIIVYGQAGDDQIKLADRVTLPSLLYGGAGNDTIDGGEADSILIGGDGNDILRGGGGRNILIGGLGADQIHGRKGGDILVAGWADYDTPTAANQQTLAAIQADWLSGGQNVTSWLSASTVHDDGAVDRLKGGKGLDWFFANYQGDGILDVLVDVVAAEMITDLT